MTDIALWIIQVLLAFAFISASSIKVSHPIENLGKNMEWVKYYPVTFVRIVAILEILGALGLILPGLTNILPWLTPVAAAGLALTMLGAILVHIRLQQYSSLTIPAVLLVVCLLIVYGRFVLAPLF